MKKVTVGLIAVFLASMFVVAGETADVEKEKVAIQQVIESAYRDGLLNVGDVDAMKKGFHPGFTLIGINRDGEDIWTLPLYRWIKSTEKKKADGKFPPKEKVTLKFPFIDVVGTAAVAKILFYKGDKHVYTDYMSLYKFTQGWQIVAKTYYLHQQKTPKTK